MWIPYVPTVMAFLGFGSLLWALFYLVHKRRVFSSGLCPPHYKYGEAEEVVGNSRHSVREKQER
jgi:hypothetical protein